MKTLIRWLVIASVVSCILFSTNELKEDSDTKFVGYWEVPIEQVKRIQDEGKEMLVFPPQPFAYDGDHVYVYFSGRRLSDKTGWFKVKGKLVGRDLYYHHGNHGWQFLASFTKRGLFLRHEGSFDWEYQPTSLQEWLRRTEIRQ